MACNNFVLFSIKENSLNFKSIFKCYFSFATKKLLSWNVKIVLFFKKNSPYWSEIFQVIYIHKSMILAGMIIEFISVYQFFFPFFDKGITFWVINYYFQNGSFLLLLLFSIQISFKNTNFNTIFWKSSAFTKKMEKENCSTTLSWSVKPVLKSNETFSPAPT